MGPDDDLSTLLSRSDHLNILRYVRAHQLREPSLVLKHGKGLLGPDLSKHRPSSAFLPTFASLDESERLAALEQVCIAALDLQDHALAELALSEIRSAVPKSSARSRRLLALCLESAGDTAGANNIYDKLLKENPSNVFALKRQYVILRSQPGKEVETKEALNSYLVQNSVDSAGWDEMAKLCLDLGDYRGAAFAYEEVVLGCPLDSVAHCRLGETYATLGGVTNLKLARKHMAQSLELDPSSLRALYGLLAVASSYIDASAESGKNKRDSDEDDMEVAKELVRYGAEKLMKVYKGTRLFGIVEKVLKEQTSVL